MEDDFSKFCEDTTEAFIGLIDSTNEKDSLKRYKFCIAEYRRLVTELNDSAIKKYKLNEKGPTENKRMLEIMEAAIEKYWKKCSPF